MSTTTTNYALVKPDVLEDADITVINANMDSLDSVVKSVSNAVVTAQNSANSALDKAVVSRFLATATTLASSTAFTNLSDGETWTSRYASSTGVQATISSGGVLGFDADGLYRVSVKVTFNNNWTAGAFTYGQCRVALYTAAGVLVTVATAAMNLKPNGDTTVFLNEILEVGATGGDITTSDDLHIKISQDSDNACSCDISNTIRDTFVEVQYLRSL